MLSRGIHVSSVENCQQALELSTKALAELWSAHNCPVRRCGKIDCQIHSSLTANMGILGLGNYLTFNLGVLQVFLDTTPAQKLDFGHKGAKMPTEET